MRWHALLFGGIATLCACHHEPAPVQLTPAEKQRLESQLLTATNKVDGYITARNSVLRDVANGMHIDASDLCTFRLPPPNALITGKADPLKISGDGQIALDHFSLLPSWAAQQKPTPWSANRTEQRWAEHDANGVNYERYEPKLAAVRESLAREPQTAYDTAEWISSEIAQLTNPSMWGWELIVVTDEITEAQTVERGTGAGGFVGGEITGRAVLWSYDEGRVLCTGAVDARSGDEVTALAGKDFSRSGDAFYLGMELQARAYEAAVANLRSVARSGK